MLRKAIAGSIIIFFSCSEHKPCDFKKNPKELQWNDIMWVPEMDSLKFISKKTDLNGEYEPQNMNVFLKRLEKDHSKLRTRIFDLWDGAGLDGILIKDSVIIFKARSYAEVCGEYYDDWISMGLDTSILKKNYIIKQTIKGPNNLFFFRTQKRN